MKAKLLLSVILFSGMCFSQSNNKSDLEEISLKVKNKSEIPISSEQKSMLATITSVKGIVISVTLINNQYNVKYFDEKGDIIM